MTIVIILVKVTLAMALALLATRLAPRSRAAVRHTVLVSAFALLLVLPVASRITPSIRVTLPIGSERLPAPVAVALDGNELDSVALQAADGAATHARDRAPAGAALTTAAALGSVWLAGIAVCAFPVLIGLRQMRMLRRSGLPWRDGQSTVDRLAREAGIRRTVQVLLHESVSGPMTCGVFRPAILLPPDARSWPANELTSAIIHELAHVARLDWATQCAARVAAAIYWFHPLVWILRRHLILEAERACDDAVLRSSEPADYADQLVLLARRLSTGNQPVLAMANRADLAARVTAVLDRRQARGGAGAATIAVVCAIAVAILLAMSPLRLVASAVTSPQTDGQAAARFETVSIKPCPDDTPPPGARAGARSGQGGFPAVSPGRFVIECGTVERMISNAYVLNGERLENNQARIGDVSWWKGGPGWLRTDKFTIEATAPGVSDRKVLLGPMLRAMLEERFKLKLRRETRDAPLYALTVARGGLKMQPIGPGGCEEYDPEDARDPRERAAALIGGAKPTCGMMHMTGPGAGGTTRWIIGGSTLADFTGTLSAQMDRFVVDRTNIADKFNIRLEFARDEHTPGADKRFGVRTDFPPADGPNIFAALEQQLGLKLESIRGPQGYLVIDHVERPTPNGPVSVPMRARGAGR